MSNFLRRNSGRMVSASVGPKLESRARTNSAGGVVLDRIAKGIRIGIAKVSCSVRS